MKAVDWLDKRVLLRFLGVAVLYGLLVVIVAMPSSLAPAQTVIGNNVDTWIFYWNNWWLGRALTEGHPPLATPYLFHPSGASLVAHSNSFSNSVLAMLLRPWMGQAMAYNTVWLLGLWLGAVGCFMLVRELTRSSAGALIAGFVFTFAPYRLTQTLAHGHLGSIHWWPFYVLFLYRALRAPDPRRLVINATAAAAFLALTVWTGLQLAVLLALWTVLAFVWHGVAPNWRRPEINRGPTLVWRQGLAALAVVVGISTALTAPLLLPVARNWDDQWTADFDRSEIDQTDLLAYLTPPTYHPLWGAAVNPIYEQFVANRAYMPYLGYSALALAFLALTTFRKSGLWAVSMVVWMVLAAGGAPRVAGTVYSEVVLPYRWLVGVFPLSTLRAPDRLNLLVVLSLAVLVGYGAARLERRAWLLLPLGLLLFTEYLPVPLPSWEPLSTSPYFETLARDSEAYAVLDYPMGYTEAKLWLAHQTVHGKPMVEGHVSRYTPDLYAFILSNPLLRALYRPQVDARPSRLPAEPFLNQPVPLDALGPALRDLTEANVRYLLVHRPYVDGRLEVALRQVLPFTPVHRDAGLEVHDLRRPLRVTYDGFPVEVSSAVTLARFDVEPDSSAARWRVSMVAESVRSTSGPQLCEVQLLAGAMPVRSWPVTFFSASSNGLNLWRDGDVDFRSVEVTVEGGLAPGDYRWSLLCPEGQPAFANEWLTALPSGEQRLYRRAANVRFAESIQLDGYHWVVEGGILRMALWWRARTSPRADLKVFVHLTDAAGHIVSQYDAVPCAWTCPTHTWRRGDTIVDYARLELVGLPPGTYSLRVGLYDAQTLDRVPLSIGTTDQEDAYTIPDALIIQHQSD